MIKLLIADDHAIVREGLRQFFSHSKDLAVVALAANGNEVLDLLNIHNIDLLLLDMNMPGLKDVDLISKIRGQHPLLPILILSMHNEPQVARRALLTGASGYVTKDSEPEILLAAIRKVASGGRFIEPGLAEAMIFHFGEMEERPLHEILSEREFLVLCKLVRGSSVNEIADELEISNKTVSTHKIRLMQKLNINNNAELMRFGLTHISL
jgi:DNA-binding NarL/FixJ family response regulator